MPAAKRRKLALALAALAVLVGAALPVGASIPRPGDQLLGPAPEALLAALEASPDPPRPEPSAPDRRFELLAPAAVDRLLFTGRSPQLHLFAELETRVRASDLLSLPQPLEIKELTLRIAPGDRETGLYYAKARYYDPELGIFVTEDPELGRIDTPPSLHRYLYAYQNPTVYVDPSGRQSEEMAFFEEGPRVLDRPEDAPEGWRVEQIGENSFVAYPPGYEYEEEGETEGGEEESLWQRATNWVTESVDRLEAALEKWDELFRENARSKSSTGDPEEDFRIATEEGTGIGELAEQTKEVGAATLEVADKAATVVEAGSGAGTLVVVIKQGVRKLIRRQLAKKFLDEGWEIIDDDVARRAIRDVEEASERAAARRSGAAPAANRAQHEQYVDGLRASMERPHVQDSTLSAIMDDLYRPDARIGSGSTAAAVRHEAATGERVRGRLHRQKGQDNVRRLRRWLEQNPTATPGDRAAAENALRDLQNALGES